MSAARPQPLIEEAAPPLWEQALAIGVTVMMSQALVGPVFAPDQGESPILRLVWLPVYAIIAGLMMIRIKAVLRAWPALLIVLLLVIHAYASKYWSIDPSTTTRRTVAMAIASLFAVYLGAAFKGPHLARMLMITTLILGLGSLVMVFGVPRIGVHQGDVNSGLWRGLWYEKNQMGLVMVAGAVASAACMAATSPRRWIPAATFLIAVVLTLATQSKTSLLCLGIGVGVIGGFWFMRKGGPAVAVVCVWMGVVAAAGAVYLWIADRALILKALGKDPTLTGRTDIWASLMRQVADHPWTGFGYQAFWVEGSAPANYVRLETQWPVPSAHNGWIDLLVQLGWPGAVSVGLVVVIALLTCILQSPGRGAREGYFGLGYLAAFLLLSMSESVLLTNANLPWVLVLAIMTRGLMIQEAPVRIRAPTRAVPLAAGSRAAYLTGPRIAAHYADGPIQRPAFPVR